MVLHLDLKDNGYDIRVERGLLSHVGSYLNLARRVLIVTDEGVPAEYAAKVAEQCKAPIIETVPQGEGSKSFAVLERLCDRMLQTGFTRSDCVVAVGGGVVGDLAGFAAACYMRGIDFYNIPTTLLSQVDSSIGGKVAVNLSRVKNCVGAFHQPKAVMIDPDTLGTLPKRQLVNGMAEAIKMALTSDAELFEIFERGEESDRLEDVIVAALKIKKGVVEQDERESGLRRILNFGHTLGHGIESAESLHGLYHGECVALGMIPMCSDEVRNRLLSVLDRIGFPTSIPVDVDTVLGFVSHDKKCSGDQVSVIYVPSVGQYEIRKQNIDAFCDSVRPILMSLKA
ncbi:MAG: 3-dehydroquinate synthase [Clostridia bacterium]|nr:3-dehydroquinate synthase [Clostridia bacterium]